MRIEFESIYYSLTLEFWIYLINQPPSKFFIKNEKLNLEMEEFTFRVVLEITNDEAMIINKIAMLLMCIAEYYLPYYIVKFPKLRPLINSVHCSASYVTLAM